MTAFKKAKLRAGPETRIQCIAHVMNLIVKAIMMPITGKHNEDDSGDKADIADDEEGARGGEDSKEEDEGDNDNDNDNDEDDEDEVEGRLDEGEIDRGRLEQNETSEDVADLADLEDERLDDDQINPGLDSEDANFLNGRIFQDGVDDFIAERKFNFLKPDSEDLKSFRNAICLVCLF
jgi:hypothetical protein